MLPVMKRDEEEDITYVYIPQTTGSVETTTSQAIANTSNDCVTVTPANKRLRLHSENDSSTDFRIQASLVVSPYDVNEEDNKLLNIDWNNLPDFSQTNKMRQRYENEIMHLRIQVKELQQSLGKRELEVLVLKDRNIKLKDNLKIAIEKLKDATSMLHQNNTAPSSPQEPLSPAQGMVTKSEGQTTTPIIGQSTLTPILTNKLPRGLLAKPSSTATRLSAKEIPRPRLDSGKPVPGVLTQEEALLYNMVPLVSGSNVFVYPEHLNSIRKKEKPTFVLRKLLRLFFTDEQLKTSNYSGRSHSGFSQLNKEITSAILAYCSDPTNFPESEVNYSKLVETINNVCAELRTVRKKPYIRKDKDSKVELGTSPLNTCQNITFA